MSKLRANYSSLIGQSLEGKAENDSAHNHHHTIHIISNTNSIDTTDTIEKKNKRYTGGQGRNVIRKTEKENRRSHRKKVRKEKRERERE